MADEVKPKRNIKGPRAVAVNYDKERDAAPRIIAKGKGAIAEKIIELAKQNNIPLYKDPDLIEVLSKLDLGQEIPAELYKLIAEVLIFVYKSNNKVGKII